VVGNLDDDTDEELLKQTALGKFNAIGYDEKVLGGVGNVI
jgi:hypothetical protein